VLWNKPSGISKKKKNQEGFEWNRTHLFLVYADDINLLHKYKQKCAETLLDANKEVSLELNSGRIKYVVMSRHQSEG
jgi:hypothetical protein